jgi:hypothetical protein
MMASCLTVSSSCSKDNDEPIVGPEIDIYEVVGTTWSESSSFSGGAGTGTYLTFSSSTARLQIAITSGTQTLTTTYNFTYKRSKNLVVLHPQEDDIATLEGLIDSSGIKMTLTNTSTNSVVATLYKQ